MIPAENDLGTGIIKNCVRVTFETENLLNVVLDIWILWDFWVFDIKVIIFWSAKG